MWNKGKQLWTIGPSRDPRWRSISRNEVWTGLGRHLPRIVESAAPLLRIVGATPVHRSRDLSPDFVLIRAACTDAMQLLLQMFGIRGDCKILVCACRELLRPDPGHVVPSKERRATQDVGDGGIALQPALPVSFTQTRGDQRKSGYRLAAKLQRVAALANVIVALRGERALDGESTLGGATVAKYRGRVWKFGKFESAHCRRTSRHALWLDIEKSRCGAASQGGGGRDILGALRPPKTAYN